MRKIRIFIIFFILTLVCGNIAYSYDLDTSVDTVIEKKYNSNKLNEDMSKMQPVQTKTVSSSSSGSKTAPKSTPVFDNSTPNISKNNPKITTKVVRNSGIKIPSGTTFKVRSNASVSNWTKINNYLTFTTVAPVYKTYITIPVGTVFKGYVTATRAPQITGNGALLEITVKSMTLNGKTIPVEGKIIKANSKLVFFNNIKGQRQYLAGVDRKINQGVNFYKKARNISSKMSSNPVGTILSIIPTVTGWAGSAVCTLTSPVTGLVQKGKNVSLPSGTMYEIKLTQDAYIN